MTDEFRLSLDLLASSEADAVKSLILEAEEAIFDGGAAGLVASEAEAEYEAVPVPADLMDGSLTTLVDLQSAIEGTSLRWRLDVVLALGDYLNVADAD